MADRSNAQGPSWFNSSYLRRWPITVDGVSSTGTVDIEVSVPAEWDDFWNNIRSDGADIVVTGEDGVTVLDYARNTFSKANRTLTLQIDAIPMPANNVMFVLWVYWFYADEGTDRSTSVTITSALTGHIELGVPRAPYLLLPNEEAPGEGVSQQQIAKRATDVLFVWWAIGQSLVRRGVKYNGSLGFEGISYLTAAQVDPGITVTNTATRVVYSPRGGLWARLQISGGTDGGDEVFKLTTITSDGRTLEHRARALIEDLT